MNLIVTCRELRYAGETYLRGARFEASDKDAKLLKAVKKAADAPADPVPMREAASVRPAQPVAELPAEPDAPEASEPEQAEVPEAEGAETMPRRAYRRRDLKAED